MSTGVRISDSELLKSIHLRVPADKPSGVGNEEEGGDEEGGSDVTCVNQEGGTSDDEDNSDQTGF
jgi:hypothetical protein